MAERRLAGSTALLTSDNAAAAGDSHAIGNAGRVELELVGFALIHVGEVEGQAHDVRLGRIVALLVVVVNDVGVAVF